MTYRLLACLVGLSALTACAETAPACADPATVLDTETGMCVALSTIDGGQRDDAAADAGPCGACDVARPVCLVEGSDAQCVQCASDDDCATGSPMCSPAHECVQCVEDGDCHDPAAAQCMDGACVPCADSTDCAGTGAATICDTSRPTPTCVECTLADSDACGVDSQTCNLVTGACDDVAPGAIGNCESCTNDLQCAPGFRCVPMEFNGAAHGVGGYCLRIASPSCPTQQYAQPVTADSLNGEHHTYCGVNQSLATCEAVSALENDVQCVTDDECPEGGLCRQVGVLPELRCTYRCASGSQCFLASDEPNKATCGDGTVNDGMNYCGGA